MSPDRVVELEVTRAGQRLDTFIAQQVANLSRNYVQRLIEAGAVLVQGKPARPAYRLQPGELVRLELPAPASSSLAPEAIPLAIVYEDEDLLAVNKPAGMAVHPSPGHQQHTLVHALLAHYPDLPGIAGTLRPGIVHRLDLDTSGLILAAKSDRGMQSLSRQFADRRIVKGYLALASGHMQPPRGLIEAPIGRDPAQRLRMAVVAGGRPARTRYSELAQIGAYTLLLALPETGRTHQIRVHLAAAGHPLAGDRLYGGDMHPLERQFLHAFALRFGRPVDDQSIELTAPLPSDLIEALSRLLALTGTPSISAAIAGMLGSGLQQFQSAKGHAPRSETGEPPAALPALRSNL